MKNTRCCPKCHSKNIVRVPDDAHRYLSNSICITRFVTVERVPVARYFCCDCGYVEEWVENGNEHNKIKINVSLSFIPVLLKRCKWC